MPGPSLNEAVEWRISICTPAVLSALVRAAIRLPSNAKVVKIWIFNHYAVTPDLPGEPWYYDFAKELVKRD